MRIPTLAIVVAGLAVTAVSLPAQDGFRFKSGVDLINVTATVSDDDGRFVPGLQKDDFSIYEDGEQQEISQFSSERVPVSLGILLDASGSMTDEKMDAARSAIDRFIFELLGPEDELFFGEFASHVRIDQDWTTDRRAVSRAVSRVRAEGGTAIYDAISAALPIAAAGRHRKKAILVISDGNDTDSAISPRDLREEIRQSEVLVYALGVDGTGENIDPLIRRPSPRPPPIPIPFPMPGRPGGIGGRGGFPQIRRTPRVFNTGERVNADALRQITDDTGGRTEIVRGFSGLNDATARIADELSKQYYLGYATTRPRDGKWHAIRVEVRNRAYTVRARRGYVAS